MRVFKPIMTQLSKEHKVFVMIRFKDVVFKCENCNSQTTIGMSIGGSDPPVQKCNNCGSQMTFISGVRD